MFSIINATYKQALKRGRVRSDGRSGVWKRCLAECLLDLLSEFFGTELAFNSNLQRTDLRNYSY